jgi:hypothetical protein
MLVFNVLRLNVLGRKGTMSFCNSMMEGCVSGNIRGIQGALVLDKQVDHRHGTDSGSPVQGVLAPFVPHTS